MPTNKKPFQLSRMQRLRRQGPAAWKSFMDKLTIAQQRKLMWDPEFVLREDQMITSAKGYRNFMMRSGRGSGKSFAAVKNIQFVAEKLNRRNILLIGRIGGDVVNNLIKDKFREAMPNYLYDESCWKKQEKEIQLKNGSVIRYYSADSSAKGSLKGPSPDFVVMDEFAHFDNPQQTYEDVLSFLRGKRAKSDDYPMLMITTTPLLIETMTNIEANPKTYTRVVSTHANLDYLDDDYIPEMELGIDHPDKLRQEVFGEYVSLDGLLYFTEDSFRDYKIPLVHPDGTCNFDNFRDSLDEVVISVDPSGAVSEKDKGSDLVGLTIEAREKGCGSGHNARYVVVSDHSARFGIEKMVEKAADMADKWHASRILQESNGTQKATAAEGFYNAMGRSGSWTVTPINSRLSKHERMGMVSPLYRNGQVTHARVYDPNDKTGKRHSHQELEREMMFFSVGGHTCAHSPDRADSVSQGLNWLHGNMRDSVDGSVFMSEEAANMMEEYEDDRYEDSIF